MTPAQWYNAGYINGKIDATLGLVLQVAMSAVNPDYRKGCREGQGGKGGKS